MIDWREQDRRPLLRTMFGEVLRRIRLDQGRTLADVASAARVSMPYLSELERGRKEASSEVLAAICAALDIDLSDLLAEARKDLMNVEAQRSVVIRLDRAGYERAGYDGPTPSAAGGTSDAVCLLASAA
jgi:transcriptional regulator with XRE-family HTH domain